MVDFEKLRKWSKTFCMCGHDKIAHKMGEGKCEPSNGVGCLCERFIKDSEEERKDRN